MFTLQALLQQELLKNRPIKRCPNTTVVRFQHYPYACQVSLCKARVVCVSSPLCLSHIILTTLYSQTNYVTATRNDEQIRTLIII